MNIYDCLNFVFLCWELLFLGGLKYEHTLKSNSKSEFKKNLQLGQPGEVPRLLLSPGQEGERP